MKGQCLCHRVEFEIDPPLPDIYQCHCSLCRKVSGAASNAAMIMPQSRFRWLQGESEIREFMTIDGFKSHFCNHCGSPVPNTTREGSAYWIPVGLLQDTQDFSLGAHVYLDSKAHWDEVTTGPRQFAEMPDAET
ncbi:MAG: GFA family protein, partial [Pseudomonadota bacterium]